MGRAERGERIFFHALAALVFAAVCAWSAAALYGGFTAAESPAVPAAETPVPAGRFRGVMLRREETLPAGAFPGTESGTRLSATETGTESALFFARSDGWEFLTPADAERLTPERLEALFESEIQAQEAPRLVYGFTMYCAALFEGEALPAPGSCRLRADGLEDIVRAELLTVTTDALGRSVLCLRLTDFPEALYGVRTVTGEILA